MEQRGVHLVAQEAFNILSCLLLLICGACVSDEAKTDITAAVCTVVNFIY